MVFGESISNGSSSRKKLFRENGQRSAFSTKYPNYLNLVTPEKTKEIQRENKIRKIEDPINNTNYFQTSQTNPPIASTNDKTRR